MVSAKRNGIEDMDHDDLKERTRDDSVETFLEEQTMM
jgi:hypothetical protein